MQLKPTHTLTKADISVSSDPDASRDLFLVSVLVFSEVWAKGKASYRLTLTSINGPKPNILFAVISSNNSLYR